MILTDEHPQSPKSQTASGERGPLSIIQQHGSSSAPLVAPPPPYISRAADDEVAIPIGEPAGRRFTKAFVVAVGIYCLIGLIVSGSILAEHKTGSWVSVLLPL